MSKAMTNAAIEAGLLHPQVIEEFRRWGCPIVEVDTTTVAKTPEEAVERIQEVLEGDDLVKLRDTDLDVIRHYIDQQRPGQLHLEAEGENTNITVYFCKTKLNEYVIPWRTEGIYGLMVDEKTFLSFSETDSSGKKHRVKVRFHDVRELFFGDTKAFMVCVPVEE